MLTVDFLRGLEGMEVAQFGSSSDFQYKKWYSPPPTHTHS